MKCTIARPKLRRPIIKGGRLKDLSTWPLVSENNISFGIRSKKKIEEKEMKYR